ncbi:transcriptional regulator [Ktedonobacteria bacterium brp13]|nr:transcriptional regulator [Ktedonobacteria bacterium brp13]
MVQFDRLFGILLVLQRTRSISATQLAQYFNVSTRTIYRDLQKLSELGVPLYSTRGHSGGIRLLAGYFLPPLTFSQGEGIVLLLGLTLLKSLHSFPFSAEMQTALQKLLVAVPAPLCSTLTHAERVIGFEHLPADIFHPEPTTPPQADNAPSEDQIITTFLQGILQHVLLQLRYGSPYRVAMKPALTVVPLGVFWDRSHWYLVGRPQDDDHTATCLWRADRVVSLFLTSFPIKTTAVFDIHTLLGHTWLRTAMDQWQQNAPVVVRLTRSQAQRLQQDWYYRHASFAEQADDQIIMTLGEDDQKIVFDLLRWLGPGAELLEPQAWREQLKGELQQILSIYNPLS